MRSYREAEK